MILNIEIFLKSLFNSIFILLLFNFFDSLQSFLFHFFSPRNWNLRIIRINRLNKSSWTPLLINKFIILLTIINERRTIIHYWLSMLNWCKCFSIWMRWGVNSCWMRHSINFIRFYWGSFCNCNIILIII